MLFRLQYLFKRLGDLVSAGAAALLLAGCANVGIGVNFPIGGHVGVGVGVNSGGSVGVGVGVGVGRGVSVGVGGSAQLPKTEKKEEEDGKKPADAANTGTRP